MIPRQWDESHRTSCALNCCRSPNCLRIQRIQKFKLLKFSTLMSPLKRSELVRVPGIRRLPPSCKRHTDFLSIIIIYVLYKFFFICSVERERVQFRNAFSLLRFSLLSKLAKRSVGRPQSVSDTRWRFGSHFG